MRKPSAALVSPSLALCLVALATPLALTAQTGVTFDVTNPQFGAVADDGLDDRPAIQAAIDAAIQWLTNNPQNGNAEVLLPSGTYDLRTEVMGQSHLLNIQGLDATERLILNGNGSKLVAHPTNKVTLNLRMSNRVTVQDLTFDNKHLPYMDGIVAEVLGNVVKVAYVRGSVPNDFPSNVKKFGWLMDPAVAGRPKQSSKVTYLATSEVYRRPYYEFTIQNASPSPPVADQFQVGDRFTYQFNVSGSNIQLRLSQDIRIDRVTTYGSSAMFVNAEFVDGLYVTDCSVEIAPGRWRSTNADGIYVQESDNVHLVGNYISGNGDDGINLTDCHIFTVLNNTIENKRRHAIRLDADSPDFGGRNSSGGTIDGNTAHWNGGGFIVHWGGDYSEVDFGTNTVGNNNRTVMFTSNEYVSLGTAAAYVNANGTFGIGSIGAVIGPDNQWDEADDVLVRTTNLGGAAQSWNFQALELSDNLTTGEAATRGLFVHRGARNDQTWLYLSAASLTEGADVVLRAANAGTNPAESQWVREPVANSPFSRLRLAASNPADPLYLTAMSSSPLALPGADLKVMRRDTSDPRQTWRWHRLED